MLTSKQIIKLIDDLTKIGFQPTLYKNSEFNDEPKFYNFNTQLTIDKNNTDGHISPGEPHGSGVSFFSGEEAMAKSIWEAMERLCNYSWKSENIQLLTSKESSQFIDLSTFSKNSSIKNKAMGWVDGWNLFKEKKAYLPAQLVYLNYHKQKDEPLLDYPHNSTGSAGGAFPEHAILNGIYEIVERDSFMGIYLNKISPPVIDLKSINDARIDYLIKLFTRYNLKLYVLDTTTDIGIPSFVSLVFDKTGAGPAIGIGAKAGLRTIDAIVGSIGEVLMTRLYTKSMLTTGEISPDLASAKGLFPNRARLWITLNSIRNIKFMIQGPKIKFEYSNYEGEILDEFKKVINIIKNKGYEIFYKDCSIESLLKLNFHSYFTFIPGLHPLYLIEDERDKVVNIKRLTLIAKHFGKEFNGINQIPHPFL